MTKSDWIEVGLRLLGVYFCVAGGIGLLGGLLADSLLTSNRLTVTVGLKNAVVVTMIAQIVVGIVLLFINWPAPKGPPPPVGPRISSDLEASLERMERAARDVPPPRDNSVWPGV